MNPPSPPPNANEQAKRQDNSLLDITQIKELALILNQFTQT